VDWAQDGNKALYLAAVNEYDAAVLDVMMPGRDGLEVCRAIRARGGVFPILMLTARDTVLDKITGLDAGGDDYLTKPFAPDEMAARVEVLLRRHQPQAENRLRVADLELDLVRHVARRGGQPLSLLPTEYRLLEFLMRNSGQVLTRTMIFEHVWGFHFDPGTNVIDVHIGRLRRKIDVAGLPALIHTVRGSGYRLAPVD